MAPKVISVVRSLSFRLIYWFALKAVSRILMWLGILEKMVIIRMDGGICSQMHFYLIGSMFEEHGFRVKYDLSWFSSNGKDIDGRFPRNFDLTTAFPNLNFKKCSSFELLFYSSFEYKNNYFDDELEYIEKVPPIYMTGYYKDPKIMYKDLLPRIFKFNINVFDDKNLQLYKEIIKNGTSVAVHVRRGDLARHNSAYGDPVSIDYFKNCISVISEHQKDLHFYFFSDEPKWVESELIPQLADVQMYEIVSINGSEKGYMDLFLISSCTHQITSKGSLGKYGAFVNCVPSRKIFVCDDAVEREKWDGFSSNIIFVKG